MRIDQLLSGARHAASVERRDRLERIATQILAVLVAGDTPQEARDPKMMVSYAASLAADLVRTMDVMGGVK